MSDLICKEQSRVSSVLSRDCPVKLTNYNLSLWQLFIICCSLIFRSSRHSVYLVSVFARRWRWMIWMAVVVTTLSPPRRSRSVPSVTFVTSVTRRASGTVTEKSSTNLSLTSGQFWDTFLLLCFSGQLFDKASLTVPPPSVLPSTKRFSDFNEIWYVGRGRGVIHDRMPHDLIQSQGQSHRGPEVVKMGDFKGYLLCQYACNQKTNGELWYSKTISIFLYFIFFGVT